MTLRQLEAALELAHIARSKARETVQRCIGTDAEGAAVLAYREAIDRVHEARRALLAWRDGKREVPGMQTRIARAGEKP